MTDTPDKPSPLRVLRFAGKAPPPSAGTSPPDLKGGVTPDEGLMPLMPVRKFGVYPLGPDDVVLSTTLFQTVVAALRAGGSAEALREQQALARELEKAYNAPFFGGEPREPK